MRKTEELRRVTLSMGAISFGLSLMIFYSFFDIKEVATETISRLPASLVVGAGDEPTKNPSILKMKMTCAELTNGAQVEVKSELLQVHFRECGDQHPIELINLTNGYQATLFSSSEGALSDLISLENGLNEIHVRLEKSPTPFSLKVDLKL